MRITYELHFAVVAAVNSYLLRFVFFFVGLKMNCSSNCCCSFCLRSLFFVSFFICVNQFRIFFLFSKNSFVLLWPILPLFRSFVRFNPFSWLPHEISFNHDHFLSINLIFGVHLFQFRSFSFHKSHFLLLSDIFHRWEAVDVIDIVVCCCCSCYGLCFCCCCFLVFY